MDQVLQELCDSRGAAMRVDRESGVIRGVKILGLESRNRRAYVPDALAAAAPLYEGAKVNVNHPKGLPGSPRDYQDRIGTIRDVTMRTGEGLFADFHFNPHHPVTEQLLWDAEHAPENVGFSHNVEARTARQGDQTVVEAILRVVSVDLVADPATTRGLYESAGEATEPPAPESTRLAEATIEDLTQFRPDLIESVAAAQAADMARLREQIEQLEAREAERAQLAESLRRAGPVSREQGSVYGAAPADAKAFVAAITG